ncbi:MAG TPA: hypothetical protein VEN81_00800, partial [Planctomycetota bacterium]|nr:hypothetical protein [Planctomycetota bacterium]
ADGFRTVVEGMRARGMAFNRILIIPRQPAVVIFNLKPAVALTTGLNSKEMTQYMASVMDRTDKKLLTVRYNYILDLE